jgi:hypothetical protein
VVSEGGIMTYVFVVELGLLVLATVAFVAGGYRH